MSHHPATLSLMSRHPASAASTEDRVEPWPSSLHDLASLRAEVRAALRQAPREALPTPWPVAAVVRQALASAFDGACLFPALCRAFLAQRLQRALG